ncbi:MAG: NADH-quinone oxidoreductase subunit N [Oscillochloris sp.]|nr:NADH-quinone oxidoreductase subunit N [Oscillochloris sp.]
MEQIVIPPVNLALIAPLLTVVAWATVLLLVDVFAIPTNNKKLTGYLAIAGLIVAGLVAIPLWNLPPDSTFSGMVRHDPYALTLTWIFLVVGIISIIMALDYLPRQGIEQGEFYALVMFAVGGMILMAQSADLIVLFLALETLSITLYILTGFAYPRLTSEEAAMKYLILGAFAAGFFVYGIALIFGATGTTNLTAIGEVALQVVGGDPTLLLLGAGMVLIAFAFKVALVPFHMWTPDVYEGSPTPVAAFMSVGTKGAALAALLRIFTEALGPLETLWLPVLSGLAALTMIVGNLGALAQLNVKRMLAYSSVGHAGYILLGVIVASDRGAQSFLFYMLAYALTNLGAFAVVIALEQRGELAWSLDDFNGLFQRRPMLAVAMAVFMFSLAGVPPTAGFMAKFYVFTAAYEGGLGWLALIGVLTSAVAAFFYLRVVVRMFMQEPLRDVDPELNRGLSFDIGLTAIATMLIGLIPTPVIFLVERSLVAAGS